ncbi:MAG: hypothetical protein WC455_29890 [Dehalococcoidia bacterium]|jgi:hypothetical protein
MNADKVKRIDVDAKCDRCGETYTVSVAEGIPRDYICFCGNAGKILLPESK